MPPLLTKETRALMDVIMHGAAPSGGRKFIGYFAII